MASCGRLLWIDYVKVFACLLVVIGHFFMSMVSAGIIEQTAVYDWFISTIYTFHVPLFFICSGYLYQKFSCVSNPESWISNVLKKLLVLGIPYAAFSTATWVLKTAFSGSVNGEMQYELLTTLFLEPTAPYWYLYCLFFLFVFVPTVKSEKGFVMLTTIAILLKASILTCGSSGIYAVDTVSSNLIWFAGGMLLTRLDNKNAPKNAAYLGAFFAFVAVAISLLADAQKAWTPVLGLLIGLLACAASVITFKYCVNKANLVFDFLAKYTMPLFLMHTLCAAPVRVALIKLGGSIQRLYTLVWAYWRRFSVQF